MTHPMQTEGQLQRAVTDLAELLGWRWLHHRPAVTDQGWRTAVSGSHAKGWPDLVLVRERLVLAELKGPRGKLSPEQSDWLDSLATAGVESYCWGPDDWDEIEATLTRVEGHGG